MHSETDKYCWCHIQSAHVLMLCQLWTTHILNH